MITLSIITSILLLLLAGILFLPLSIIVNTNSKDYTVKLPGIFRVDLLFNSINDFKIRFRLFGIGFKIDPMNMKRNTKKVKVEKVKKKNHKQMKQPIQFFKRLLGQFKIKRFEADIDTGNFPLNAQLIPVVYTINRQNINCSINFESRNYADIKITTRIYRLLIELIKSR